jgi:hypothetical protein
LDISINTHWSPTNSTQISFFVLFSRFIIFSFRKKGLHHYILIFICVNRGNVYELYCYALAELRSIDEFFRSVVLGLFHTV